jgi:DNA polymerase III subunit delta
MLLKPEALATHLEKALQPIYAVYGDELLTLECADAVRAAARRQGFDERETLVALPGFKWEQLLAATANLSLFGGRKLVDLRIPSGKPGTEGAAILKRLAAQASPDTLLLVSLPELSWQEEKAVWLGELGEAGVLVKSVAPGLAELPAWLGMRLQRQGQKADVDALRFVAERTEGNLLAAHQEVLKLGLLYPPGQLNLEQVREAVLNVARYDLESLREALLRGDLARFARTLDGLRQEGEALPLVVWAISEEVRALLQIKVGQEEGKALPVLYKEAKVWGPRQNLLGKAIGQLKRAPLASAMQRLAHIDRMVKGVATGDPWTELLQLGVQLKQGG